MRAHISVLILLLTLVATARPARACDLILPNDFKAYTRLSEAIATLRQHSSGVIVLEVQEYLKGGALPPRLTLNNYSFAVGPDCSMEPRAGGRLPVQERVLVYLQRDEFSSGAQWRPAGVGARGILCIVRDRLIALDGGQDAAGTLNEARLVALELVGPAQRPGPAAPAAEPLRRADPFNTVQVLIRIVFIITALFIPWCILSLVRRAPRR